MSKKKRFKRKKRYVSKYSKEQKRAFWVGYGIALSEKKSNSPGYRNEGEIFLNSGYIPSTNSAKEGYKKAFADSERDKSKRFSPKEYWY